MIPPEPLYFEKDPLLKALEVSKRWLVVDDYGRGNVMRYGPFTEKDEAEEYASQRCEGAVEIVEMHDIGALDETYWGEKRKQWEREKYERAMKAS